MKQKSEFRRTKQKLFTQRSQRINQVRQENNKTFNFCGLGGVLLLRSLRETLFRISRFGIIFLVILLAYSQADMIYLRNGKIIEGEITETTPGVFIIKGKGGSFTVGNDMLLRVVRRDETETPADLVIEIGSVVKKDDAEKLKTAVAMLGFPDPQIVDEPPYYKVRVGPYRKETDAIAAAQKIDTAKLLNAYPTGSKVFHQDLAALNAFGTDTAPTEMNIALTVNGAVVTADSMLAGFPATNAVDGNVNALSSRWVSDSSRSPHWLAIDFGKPKPFTRIELYTGESHNFDYLLRDFALQYWSGSEWKDIEGAQKKNNLVENPRFTFAEVTAAKVRLYVMKGSNVDNIARVYELKIFSQPRLDSGRGEFDRTALLDRAYQIRLVQPSNFLNPQSQNIVVNPMEWYTISCSVAYRAQATAVLSASILPDATKFWTDAKFRRELELVPDDYNTTINFDTQRTPGYANVVGTGDLSFSLKSKSPRVPGAYPKILRIALLNPETRNSLVFQEIPFTLQVE
jgi:hypothetical protein